MADDSLTAGYKTVCAIRCSLAASLIEKHGRKGKQSLIVFGADEFPSWRRMRVEDSEMMMAEAVTEALNEGWRGLTVIEDTDETEPAHPWAPAGNGWYTPLRGLHYWCFYRVGSGPGSSIVSATALPRLDLRPFLYMDRDAWHVTVRDRVIDLSPTEFALLWRLACTPGQVVRYGELAWTASIPYESLAAHIYHLRCKTEVSSGHPPLIKTVRGVGYRFDLF